jgi:D-sedoheptulose 7-phosphate isomerase
VDYSESVVDLFHRHIESCMYTMEAIGPSVAAASECIVASMLNERKILCCGEGSFALLAQQLAGNLINRFQRERPSLPAMALNTDAATLTAIAADSGYNDIFSNQIRALGQEGDCLVLLYSGNGSTNTLRCIQSAHERGMRVIALSNLNGGDASALLSAEDIELAIPVEDKPRVIEMQLIAIHSICELVDAQLFGIEQP